MANGNENKEIKKAEGHHVGCYLSDAEFLTFEAVRKMLGQTSSGFIQSAVKAAVGNPKDALKAQIAEIEKLMKGL
jgi:hypothetical protein